MHTYTDYLVMTWGAPPDHDHGSFSEHHDEDSAVKLAARVGGKAYRRVTTSDSDDTILTLLPEADPWLTQTP